MEVESYSFPELLDEISCIKLHFRNMFCYIGLVEDSDEIILSKSIETDHFVKSTNNEIWKLFIGKGNKGTGKIRLTPKTSHEMITPNT